MTDKQVLLSLKPKRMYLARKIGENPVQVFETTQFLDTTERVWDTGQSHLTAAGRCAVGYTEDSARSLLIWGAAPLSEGGIRA